MIHQKRGLSTIVVTLILIVLSLVAVGAIWVIVSGVIKTGSDNSDISGLTLNLKIVKAVSVGENLSVTVQRNPGKGQMSKIKFVISDGTNSEVVTRNASLEELASQTFNFPITQMSLSNIKSISIASVFLSDKGEETTGQISDIFSVSGVGLNGEYSGSGDNSNNPSLTCTPSCTGTDVCTNGVCVPENCLPNSIITTCGTWACGSKINNCGQNVSCGNPCPNGFDCVGGICTTPSCIPDCAGRECGIDPICSQICGVCPGSEQCSTDTWTCVPENCSPDLITTTCGTWNCGNKTNNCGQTVSCGAACSSGTLCLSGTCTPIYPINTGTVEETWPGTSGLYFGSNNLSRNSTYENKYIKFPGSSETRCLVIAVSKLPIAGYDKSHVGFNFRTNISSGNTYQIWPSLQYCMA
jgi:hypothetical protein